MRNARQQLVDAISKQLGKRELFWFGTRGDDATTLINIPQFAGSFTYINRYARHDLDYSIAYEDIAGHRVDLDAWDIDDHLTEDHTLVLRRSMLRAMGSSNAVVPYRPSQFLSALAFARQETTLNLGLFASQQHVFEYKPWVETAVRELGVPTLEWKYIADEDQLDAGRLFANGPIVVRPSRGSGGSGMKKVTCKDELAEFWPVREEFFASVSHYYADCLPINVGAVVWPDGVTVHHPSVQLIGIPDCVGRPFGYCGNDFALPKAFTWEVIDQIESSAKAIGNWMRTQGYLGAFGVDYLLDGDILRFTEVNPRFQGSTRVSAYLSALQDEACILLDHIGAFLKVPMPQRPPLRETVRGCPDMSNVVIHNTLAAGAQFDAGKLADAVRVIEPKRLADVTIAPDKPCDLDGAVLCLALPRSVTESGYAFHSDLKDAFELTNALAPSKEII